MTNDKIHLTVECESYVPSPYDDRKAEHASREVLKFTRTEQVQYPILQCGLRFSAYEENFIVYGFADRMSMEIKFQAEVKHSFCDGRITYLRKHRKEIRKKYAGWKLEVVKEAEKQYQ